MTEKERKETTYRIKRKSFVSERVDPVRFCFLYVKWTKEHFDLRVVVVVVVGKTQNSGKLLSAILMSSAQ